MPIIGIGAFTEQRYKIWKQFSTCKWRFEIKALVLLLNKDTKFESNSQHRFNEMMCVIGCFYWTKIQNLKAILNKCECSVTGVVGAFTEQRYKIWKQFSTPAARYSTITLVLLLNKDTKFESNSQPMRANALQSFGCFYWTKIQNLKAILNASRRRI